MASIAGVVFLTIIVYLQHPQRSRSSPEDKKVCVEPVNLNSEARVLCALLPLGVLSCNDLCFYGIPFACLLHVQRSRSSPEDSQVRVELPFCFKLYFPARIHCPLDSRWL